MPFGIQPIHIIVVAIVALLIFGPARLPEIGRGVGRAITEFRRGAKEMGGSFMEELNQPIDSTDEPQHVADGTAAASASQDISVTSAPSREPAAEGNFCIHCGKSNPAGAVYCNQCGSKITE